MERRHSLRFPAVDRLFKNQTGPRLPDAAQVSIESQFVRLFLFPGLYFTLEVFQILILDFLYNLAVLSGLNGFVSFKVERPAGFVNLLFLAADLLVEGCPVKGKVHHLKDIQLVFFSLCERFFQAVPGILQQGQAPVVFTVGQSKGLLGGNLFCFPVPQYRVKAKIEFCYFRSPPFPTIACSIASVSS